MRKALKVPNMIARARAKAIRRSAQPPARIPPSVIRSALAADPSARSALRLEGPNAYIIRAQPNSVDNVGRVSFAYSVRSAVRRSLGMTDPGPKPVERGMGVREAMAVQAGQMVAGIAQAEMIQPFAIPVFRDPYTGCTFSTQAALDHHMAGNYGRTSILPVMPQSSAQGIPGSRVPVKRA